MAVLLRPLSFKATYFQAPLAQPVKTRLVGLPADPCSARREVPAPAAGAAARAPTRMPDVRDGIGVCPAVEGVGPRVTAAHRNAAIVVVEPKLGEVGGAQPRSGDVVHLRRARMYSWEQRCGRWGQRAVAGWAAGQQASSQTAPPTVQAGACLGPGCPAAALAPPSAPCSKSRRPFQISGKSCGGSPG